MNPTERIAEFIVDYPAAHIPTHAISTVRTSVMDYVGVLLAGLQEPSTQLVRGEIVAMGGTPEATLYGTGYRAPAALAARANGTAAHALDLDDLNCEMLGHPSLQLLPATLALAEGHPASGTDIVAAYVVGFELGIVLARAMVAEHVRRGWFPVGTLGPIMQTAASARLLGLTPVETRMALGIAANTASGLRCNSGTMAKHFQAGHGASSAVLSVRLARAGMTSHPDTLAHPSGFCAVLGGVDPEQLRRALEPLGDPDQLFTSTIVRKQYPCCGATHTTIDCALDIARTHEPPVDEIAGIDIHVQKGVRYVLTEAHPTTTEQAQFSLAYCVSRALLEGELGWLQFDVDRVTDPSAIALMDKVTIRYRETPLTPDEIRANHVPTSVTVQLNDGRTFCAEAECARGTPQNPVSSDELEAKFRRGAGLVLTDHGIDETLTVLGSFEHLDTLSPLLEALTHRRP